MLRHVALGIALAACTLAVARQKDLFAVLRSTAHIGKQPDGVFLVSTNQLLKPWGEVIPIKGRPVELAFDSRKSLLAVLNWRGVDLLHPSTGLPLATVNSRSTSYTGLAFHPTAPELWASETSRNGGDGFLIAAIGADGKPTQTHHWTLPGHPVPCGIAFSKDGQRAFAALSRNNTLAILDPAQRRVIREVDTGMAPFGVAYCARENRIFVTNRGGRRPKPGETAAPSSGSNVLTDAKTGATASGTVSVIDATTFAVQEIEAGLAPSSLAISPDESTLAVANGHSDSVSIIDTKTLRRTDVAIPAFPEHSAGSQPINTAFSPSGDAIYVTCGGTNAIAVLRRGGGAWKVEGLLPTAWFPSGVAVASDGGLRVIAIKGLGNTQRPEAGSFNSRAYEGALLRIPTPIPAQLAAGTREVRAANAPKFEPNGGVSNLASLGIQHVVFIIKENRTYDQVFGDIPKGNGEPKFLMYGRDITPNHHALAERYVLLDNFYTGGAISFDGHHWLMQAFVSDYVERAFGASPRGYAWNLADALTVSPSGFFWQSANRPLGVRVYGEFCLPGKWDPSRQSVIDMNEADEHRWPEYWRLYKEGKWQGEVGCRPGVPAIASLNSLRYPHSTTEIPDQIRAEEFLRELAEREKSGTMPNISVLTLNQDHTNGTRPGSPTPRAMVADNDLALGRIVEGISKSRFWPKTLILVTEDDAQDGLDHVDGRRTLALVVGPHIRRGQVDSNHYNHTSMVRTIQDVFRIPPRTRHLASARAMNSAFTNQPNLEPYAVLQPKVALDEMNPPARALKGRQLWAARESAAMNWSEPDDIPQATLNRILWWDAKGWDTAYPTSR